MVSSIWRVLGGGWGGLTEASLNDTLLVVSLALIDITAKLEPLSGGGGALFDSGGEGWLRCWLLLLLLFKLEPPGFRMDVGGICDDSGLLVTVVDVKVLTTV